MMYQTPFDPITLEIWWSRLVAITDEAATALLRTAFSTIVRESNDFATVLMDSRGESIAECSGGIPAFAGLIPRAVQAMLRKFPAESWQPGDCVLTNDPWIGTGHLPDVTVVMPVFHRGLLVGFTGSTAHLPDIGGNPSPLTRQVFEEGVFIPPMRLDRAGVRDASMLELFLANVRLPEQVVGDLEAQVTANMVGGQRAVEFLVSSGLASFDALAPHVQRLAEATMRRAIAEIPDGTYTARLEADGFEQQPTTICCAITVDGDRMSVDYAGSSPQVDRGTNCTLNYTRAYTVYPLKCALEPFSRRNAGTYRPIDVRAPEGSILNARRPAAVGARHLTGHLCCCAVFQALAQVLPGKVLADSGGSPALRVGFGGRDAQGRPFTQILFASGGMGASRAADGLSTTAFPTNSGAGSIEALETAAPLLVERKTFRPDSGGAGRQRGGLGQECVVRNMAPQPVQLAVFGDRELHPALGVQGGRPGASAAAMLETGTRVPLKSMTVLPAGAAVTLLFPGGGGFGAPGERTDAALHADFVSGLVSAEGATRDYGRRPATEAEALPVTDAEGDTRP